MAAIPNAQAPIAQLLAENILPTELPHKQTKGPFAQFVRYTGTTSGAGSIAGLIKKVINLVIEIFKNMGETTKETLHKISSACSIAVAVQFPYLLREAWEAVKGKMYKGVREVSSGIKKLADLAENSLQIAGLFKPSLNAIAQYPGALGDTLDIANRFDRALLLRDMKQYTMGIEGGKFATAINRDISATLLKMAKAVCSVALFVLGFFLLIPRLVILGIGILGSTLGIAGDLTNQTSPLALKPAPHDFLKELEAKKTA